MEHGDFKARDNLQFQQLHLSMMINMFLIFHCEVCLQNNFHHKISCPAKSLQLGPPPGCPTIGSFCTGTPSFNPTFRVTRPIFLRQNQLQCHCVTKPTLRSYSQVTFLKGSHSHSSHWTSFGCPRFYGCSPGEPGGHRGGWGTKPTNDSRRLPT